MGGVVEDNGSDPARVDWTLLYGDVWQVVEFEVEWEEEMIAYLLNGW